MSGPVDLRCGDWREALADVGEVHSVIADAPYSPRTHKGFRSARGAGEGLIATGEGLMEYAPLTLADVSDLVAWARRVTRWFVMFGDHTTSTWWREALELDGWYVFHPLPWVKRGATPRFTGDGPASASEHITVAGREDVVDEAAEQITIARRTGIRDGAKPGWYESGRVEGATNGSLVVGHKPLALMRAIVRDYSRPGDLVVDPFCGSGTTAEACAIEGRRCITSEMDPKTFAIAERRLKRGHTPDFFSRGAS